MVARDLSRSDAPRQLASLINEPYSWTPWRDRDRARDATVRLDRLYRSMRRKMKDGFIVDSSKRMRGVPSRRRYDEAVCPTAACHHCNRGAAHDSGGSRGH